MTAFITYLYIFDFFVVKFNLSPPDNCARIEKKVSIFTYETLRELVHYTCGFVKVHGINKLYTT